jgi:hypothetical protein
LIPDPLPNRWQKKRSDMKTQLLSAVMSDVPVSITAGNNVVRYAHRRVTVEAVGKAASTRVPDVTEALLVHEQLPLVMMALRGKRPLPHGWRMAA